MCHYHLSVYTHTQHSFSDRLYFQSLYLPVRVNAGCMTNAESLAGCTYKPARNVFLCIYTSV